MSFIRFSIGDDKEHFCLQSVSKCLHYPIVLEDLTAEVVSRKLDLYTSYLHFDKKNSQKHATSLPLRTGLKKWECQVVIISSNCKS